jgi:hypothetical protein
MSTHESDLAKLRHSMTELKKELAKIIAAVNLGDERTTEDELSNRLEVSKTRGYALSMRVEEIRTGLSPDHEAHAELDQIGAFLSKMQGWGMNKGPDVRQN